MPPLLMPGPLLGPLGYARGGARVPVSRYSLAFAAASAQYVTGASAVHQAEPLLLSAWFKLAVSGVNSILYLGSPGEEWGLLEVSGALWALSQGAAGNVQATGGSLSVGTWYHGAGYFGGPSLRRVFLNGSQAGVDNTGTRAVSPASWTVRVGLRNSGVQAFDGNVDECRIYDAAGLSDAQVAAAVAALAAGSEPATGTLVHRWAFEEGTGTTTADSSGNGNTGTLNGPTWSTDVPTALQ